MSTRPQPDRAHPLPAALLRSRPPLLQALTAADVVASIHGTSPDTQLTARALANMSDAQFQALYDELMAKGDKKKLMDLFGH